MLIVVAYDVNTATPEGRRRLRRVARACEDYGQRVQFSVFECVVDNSQWVQIRNRLIDEIDEEEDSLRFYMVGNNWHSRVEHIGAKRSYDPEGPMVV
jgi:CRISPR-associated protein Cas2